MDQRASCRDRGLFGIHQIWTQGYSKMKPRYKEWSSEIARIAAQRGIPHRVWDDNSIGELLEENWGPEWRGKYLSIPYPAMKADVGRYAILHLYGGLYIDADMRAEDKFGDLLDFLFYGKTLNSRKYPREKLKNGKKIVVCFNHPGHLAEYFVDTPLFNNNVLYCTPGASFFKTALYHAMANLKRRCIDIKVYYIPRVSGPTMLNETHRVYKKNKHKHSDKFIFIPTEERDEFLYDEAARSWFITLFDEPRDKVVITVFICVILLALIFLCMSR